MIKRIFLFALLLLTQYTFAQIPKPQKNTYVNDFAYVLSKDQVNSLNKQIYTIEKASTVQIAIVLVKTVPAKYTIDKFAVQIGRKWNVGKAHNGIVYVAAINQHKQHIELDSASLQKITALEQEWLLDDIKPYFRKNDYYGGLTNLTQQVSKYVTPPPAPAAEPVAQKAKPAEPGESVIWPLFIILGMVVGFVWLIVYVIKRMIRDVRENRASGLYSSSSSGGGFFSRRRYRNRWGNDHIITLLTTIMKASHQLVQAGMTTMMITVHLIGGIGVVYLIMMIATTIKDGAVHLHHRAVVFQTAAAQLPIGNR